MRVDVLLESSQGGTKLQQLPGFLKDRCSSSIVLFGRCLAYYSAQSIRLKQSYIVSSDELSIVVDIVDGIITLTDRLSPSAIDELYAPSIHGGSNEAVSFVTVNVNETKDMESSQFIKKGSDYSVVNNQLLHDKAKQFVNDYNKFFESGINQNKNNLSHSAFIQIASLLLSVLAAYKAYLGTRLFVKTNISSNETATQVSAVIAGFPAIAFYNKSMVIKLSQLLRCNGDCKPNLALDVFLGMCYGVSSFGMLQMADSSDGVFLLHLAVGVVNTFLGAHKSAVISKLVCPSPVIEQKYQSPLHVRMKVIRDSLFRAVSAVASGNTMDSLVVQSDLVLVQIAFFKAKLLELIQAQLQAAKQSQQSDRTGLLLENETINRMSMPITKHFTTDRFEYSCRVKTFGGEIDLLYPVLAAW
jgi:hypothetical protein